MSTAISSAINDYVNPGISGAVAGGTLGSVVPGIGTAIGAVAGSVLSIGASLLGKNDNSTSAVSQEDQMTASLFNHYAQQDNMRYQMELNKQLQADAFNYNSLLSDKQFEQNKWFAQNNMINSYNQLKQLGINPLLMSPQGSGGSTGLANVGTSSVGLGNTAAFDPANAVSANASSANAKIARLNAFTNILDKVTDIKVKNANSALMGEQASTEVNRRNLMDAEAGLKITQKVGQEIDNINAPEWWKAKIKRENNEAKSTLIRAIASQVGANASMIGASAKSREVEYTNLNNMYKNETDRYESYLKGLGRTGYNNTYMPVPTPYYDDFFGKSW